MEYWSTVLTVLYFIGTQNFLLSNLILRWRRDWERVDCYCIVTDWQTGSQFYLWPNIDMSCVPLDQLSSLSRPFCPCRLVPIRPCWQLQVSAYVRHKAWRQLCAAGLVTSLGPSCQMLGLSFTRTDPTNTTDPQLGRGNQGENLSSCE